MSVIRPHTAATDLKVIPQTEPGWHGLAAMTRPVSLSTQILRTLRSLLRPVARPVKRMVIQLCSQRTKQQLAELRAGQADLLMALQDLAVERAGDIVHPLPAMQPGRRLVWISSWQTRCGIAEYSRQMLDGLQAHNFGWKIKVMHDQRPGLPQISAPLGVSARPGFRLDGVNNIPRLAQGIAAERADCVVIQHHAALIPWDDLADLLLHKALMARRVVVLLHNTQDILSLPPWLRHNLFIALSSVACVMVHTPRDMALLHAFGLDNLQRVPHGCAKLMHVPPPRVLPPNAAPLIGCTGFLMPHKGAQSLIRAVAELRDIWPDIRLRLVMAHYKTRKSEAEFRACTALANKLRFAGHVEWHTDFLPPYQAQALLSECDLLVLPYGKTHESSSASARMAVASGVPTLVTEQPIFDDLRDAVGRVNNVAPCGLAGQIEEWLHATRRRTHLQQQARAWQAEHDWGRVGKQMADVLDRLVRG